VDGESASASELLAAALQDHRRAVVVGGEKTFGKGTVQATFPLGEYLHSKFRAPVGGLLVTLGKFYRVSGQSTQLSGVRPDVILPSTLDVPGRGESSLGFPLPHDSIPPVWGPVAGAVSSEMLQELRLRSERRREGSVLFKCIARERERLKKEWEHNRVSLLEAERRAEREEEQKEYAYWQSLMRGAPEGSVYAKLRLEDLKLKVLERSAGDEFRSTDPEWVATEEETLAIMEDLIRLWK
jgi:carboxyl-terminal processing protease